MLRDMVVNFIDPSFVKTSRIVYVLDQQIHMNVAPVL
ncbi:hypothetical protein EMIT0P291_10029 [Pseudomonas sp. IT-P291]